MLRAIIMDFNGIIVNDESIHFELIQKLASEHDIQLTEADYYSKLLPLDDQRCFQKLFKDASKELSEKKLKDLIKKKEILYQQEMVNRLVFFPGVAEFIQKAASRYAMGICSGARRSEIEHHLKQGHLLRYFATIVSADDVFNGKPDPEGLEKACVDMNQWLFKQTRGFKSVTPEECLVIEDSIEGIEMAHNAKMKCLSVTNTYPAEKLKNADMIIDSFEEIVVLDQIEQLFS